MARHIFFAITLIGVVLNSPAKAALDAMQCEDQAANCVGRCANPGGGTNDNKCMLYCDRQVTRCLIRANGATTLDTSDNTTWKCSNCSWSQVGGHR
jgi:hypothetical protein